METATLALGLLKEIRTCCLVTAKDAEKSKAQITSSELSSGLCSMWRQVWPLDVMQACQREKPSMEEPLE